MIDNAGEFKSKVLADLKNPLSRKKSDLFNYIVLMADSADFLVSNIESKMAEQYRVIDRFKKLHIRLTNCDLYTDDGEIAGVFCPSDLLRDFDKLFNEVP